MIRGFLDKCPHTSYCDGTKQLINEIEVKMNTLIEEYSILRNQENKTTLRRLIAVHDMDMGKVTNADSFINLVETAGAGAAAPPYQPPQQAPTYEAATAYQPPPQVPLEYEEKEDVPPPQAQQAPARINDSKRVISNQLKDMGYTQTQIDLAIARNNTIGACTDWIRDNPELCV